MGRAGERAARGELPQLKRVKADVEDLLGVVQAAETRCTVPLEGEFAAEQTGVAAALATAFERACQATAAAAATSQRSKPIKTPRSSTVKSMSERFRVVVGEAEEVARNQETPSDAQRVQVRAEAAHDQLQGPVAQLANLAGFEQLACMLNGSRYALISISNASVSDSYSNS